MPEKIMIVAGEASGDMHGGNLARAIKRLVPGVRLVGMGGTRMREAGVETLVDISDISVVGIWEVITHFKDIRRAFGAMKAILKDDPPAAAVFIDYPDFNLRLAAVARAAGVPVAYYISPQVWAWRKGRVKTIARVVDKMLVAFPFEEEFYKNSGVDSLFVGHPLLDETDEIPEKSVLAARFGIDPDRPVLGLLPGSRRKEVSFHLPVMLAAYRLIKEKVPEVQGIIPVADTLGFDDFTPYMHGFEDVKLVRHDTDGVMAVMDTAVVASGTATLQTALHGKPMVIIYRLSPLTYHIGRRLIKLKYIGMVNLVAGEGIVPELIQDDATALNISSLILKMFYDKAYYGEIIGKLAGVRAKLGGPGASRRAAEEVVGLAGLR
jgi:lipid-A-disaccharide synthase